MTKLTWTCDYIDGVYLFHTGIKGDKKYEKGMKKLADRMPKILEANTQLYEEMLENESFRNNEFISQDDIEEFLLNCAYGTPAVMKEAEGGYSMGGSDAEGTLLVDGKPFPPPENWDERGGGFWCGGEHNYDDEKGHTYEADGNILFRWNKEHDEKDRYMDVILGNEATIFEFQRFGEGKWELEIDGDFDYMKMTFDGKKCRVLYDGKEFKKVDEGINQMGRSKKYYWCFLKTEWGIERDDDYNPVLDKNGNEIMRYTYEEIPTADYLWEGYGYS